MRTNITIIRFRYHLIVISYHTDAFLLKYKKELLWKFFVAGIKEIRNNCETLFSRKKLVCKVEKVFCRTVNSD